jgi:aryl-alcohol dehydrogenase-like predicted oxidoreductase
VSNETTRRIKGEDASTVYIRRACEASLQRLKIDLYKLNILEYDHENVMEVPAMRIGQEVNIAAYVSCDQSVDISLLKNRVNHPALHEAGLT